MKKLLFIFLFLFLIEPVFANDDLRFYYNEDKVDDIWITRKLGTTIKSSNPYILRRKSDHSYVYCIQPIAVLNKDEEYTAYDTNQEILNLSDEEWEKISTLAYFGYMFPGHEDKKWYGITQYLIWKVVAKDIDVYFSDGKNGKRIQIYEKEIEEIETLIQNYQELKEINHKLVFKNVSEWNNWTKKYKLLDYMVMSLDDEYSFFLPTNKVAFGADIVYHHPDGQDVFHPGDLATQNISLEVEFLKGKIELYKKRKEDGLLSNEIDLSHAIYGIYQDGLLVETIETDSNGYASSSLLEYGIYTIRELEAPFGYSLDEEIYTICVDDEFVSMEVYEEQIMKEITIEKWYGSGTYRLEEGAIFDIYQDEQLVMTVETDSNGLASFSLPYGTYRLHQVKGMDGYQNVSDIIFTVDEVFDGVFKLYNKEIIPEVPNTGFISPLLLNVIFKSIWRCLYVL